MSSNISGTLHSILNTTVEAGAVEVALCGYGSQIPRLNGAALGARITDDSTTPDNTGFFRFTVYGNDVIQPQGTYYTVTVKDDNGDIVQVNAYQFADGTDYDLDHIPPFDPSYPPQPLGPGLGNELVIVADAPNVVFDGSLGTCFKIQLTQDTVGSWQNGSPGNLYTFIITQDVNGGHQFTWPPQVHNATPVNMSVDGGTYQTFVCDDTGALWPIGAGTYYP